MSGSRIVICKDKAEALRMHDAGLLMLHMLGSTWNPSTMYEKVTRDWLVENYNMSSVWPSEDFGYWAEDES